MPITRRKRANPPEQPESNNNNHVTEPGAEFPVVESAPSPAAENVAPPPPALPERVDIVPQTPPPTRFANPSLTNGDRVDRPEYMPAPQIEGGRRTARGELFRRPPQPPPMPAQPVVATPQPALQPPAREISLPLGNLLHLAYNPGYTGSDDARSKLLHHLADESKAGGRARCWNCGSIAIMYDRWSTRSKTFGEIGIAFCEICGVWSVM